MPLDDAATDAATRDILAALERDLTGGARVGAQRSDVPADLVEPDAASARDAGLPFGHGPVRLGGTVVAGPPDDAFEMAQLEILAALTGAPPPGAL